eukprot:scaffold21721_cov306-Skeletonema_marinoi.AAC.1
MLVDRSSQPASSVKAGKAGKGQRKTKFVPPAVTSIVWSSVEDSYLAQIAADKLGGRSKLPTNDHAVGKAAFNAYSAKDLAFILQGVGFSQSPFPTKKAALIKAILAIRYDNNHLSQDNSSEHHAGLSPAVEGKASSASLVSVSPRRRSSIGIVPVVGSKISVFDTTPILIACDDLIGPGWSRYDVPRKDGSNRVDSYFLSPAGPNQVKLRSISSARQHHQANSSVSVDDLSSSIKSVNDAGNSNTSKFARLNDPYNDTSGSDDDVKNDDLRVHSDRKCRRVQRTRSQ